MIQRLLNIIIFLSFFVSASAQANNEEWESMFNGKDLSKWKPKIRNHPAGEILATPLG